MATESKLGRFAQLLLTVVSVSIAAIGLYLGIISRKKEITVTHQGNQTVVSMDRNSDPGVKVLFGDQQLRSLTKVNYVLENTGAGAIKDEDVKEEVTLRFPSSVKVLSSTTDNTVPQFSFSSVADGPQGTVTLKFKLLNSGDKAFFSVYIYDSDYQRPTLAGRIVDVPNVVYATAPVKDQTAFIPFVPIILRRWLYWALILANSAIAFYISTLAKKQMSVYAKQANWLKRWQPTLNGLIETVKKLPEPTYDEVIRTPWKLYWLSAEEIGAVGVSRRHLLEREIEKSGIPSRPLAITPNTSSKVSYVLGQFIALGVFVGTVVYIVSGPRP